MKDDFKPVPRPAKPVQDDSALHQTPKPTASHDESFNTPEVTAARDDLTRPVQLAEEKAETGRFATLRQKLTFQWPPRKKEWLTSAGVILFGGILIAFVLTHSGDKPVVSAVKSPTKKLVPTSSTIPSTLTGLPVNPDVNQRTVTGVMIENSLDARPQSGLSTAGVVFEAIAEGGITRFLALYQDTEPENVGPIRSARPYYAQWALGFDAGYAHVGGSPEALEGLKNWSVRDLDQSYNPGSFHRITTREAPHNVYTSIAALNQLETSRNYLTSHFTGFARKTKESPSKTPTAKTIDLSISGPTYNVHYDYNASTNSYTRFEGGASHMDANGNIQISPKVVVALVMPYGVQADGYHSEYSTIGDGTAYVFQDGIVTVGKWSKTANANQFTFTDDAGKPLAFNPGQTWLTALGDPGRVTYAP